MDTTMVQQIGAQVTGAIATLADKLQAPAEHVYGILVRQSMLDGFTSMIWVVAMMLLCAVCTAVGVKSHRSESMDFEGKAVAISIFSTLAICFLIIGIACATSAVRHIINPEYYAIQNILSVL